MTHMLREIREQPDILEALASSEYLDIQALVDEMEQRGTRYISICARGTSDNAATLGKYLFEIVGGKVTSLAAPSVFTLYHSKLDLSKWLVLGISQSGESIDVVDVVKRARDMGALTASVTNAEGSTLSGESDFHLFCHAGEEKSIAATKTYTATLGVLYRLAGAMSGNSETCQKLKRASREMRSALSLEGIIEKAVERYRYMDECMVIARGINQATCQEAALKMDETCYVVAKPYSASDLQHGPIATISEGFPVFLYAPAGRGYEPMLDVARKLHKLGAELIIFSTEDEILSKAGTPIKMPVALEEIYTPLVYIIAGQLFAHYLSLSRGLNPDQPRGLKKVTKTL